MASFSQGDFLRDLSLQGEGVIRLADYHIGNDIRLGKLVPILTEYKSKVKGPLYVIYANRKLQSPRIKCFIEFLQRKLKLHPWKIGF